METEIKPGSYWRLKDYESKFHVVGRSFSDCWVVEAVGVGLMLAKESDFLAPWTDPPKPRVVKGFVSVADLRSGNLSAVAFETRELAENWELRCTRFPVVEVTITEEVRDAR